MNHFVMSVWSRNLFWNLIKKHEEIRQHANLSTRCSAALSLCLQKSQRNVCVSTFVRENA